MRDPSWRAALLGAVREPMQVGTVAAATALLVVAAATGVLVEWSSGQAAIEQLAAASDRGGLAVPSLDLAVSIPPDVPDIAQAVDGRLDQIDGYDDSGLQITSIAWLVRRGGEAVEPVVRASGRIAPAVLFHREGALESLEVVAGPDPDGEVWLPAELAERLRLVPGDALEVGLEPVGAAATRTGAVTTLAGTYATDGGRPRGLLSDPAVRLPPAPRDRTEPAPLVLTDAATMARLGEEFGDLQTSTLQVSAGDPPRYEDLRRGVEQLQELQQDLIDAESEIGAMIYERFNGPEVRVSSGVRRLVTQAGETAEAVAAQTAAAATAGVLLAAATVAAAAFAAARRQRDETHLELVQGSAPVAIGARAGLVVAPGVVLGAVLGRLVVLPVAATVLPGSRVPAPAVAALTPRAALVAAVAMAVLVAVRTLDARLRLAALGGWERSRTVPVVPMLLVAAGIVTIGVVVGPPRPPTDPLVMVMPVVVIAAVAVVVLRALVAAVPTGSAAAQEPSAAWLARRRLTGQSTRLVAVGTIVATAAGLVANAAVLRSSGEVAVEAKAAALAGAQVVVGVPTPTLAAVGGVPEAHTVVLLDESLRVLPDEAAATLQAVDPATFGSVATWPAGTGPSSLAVLASADTVGLPVLAVDPEGVVPDRGTVERPGQWTLPYEVVGRPTALPGTPPGEPLLLATQEALFARLDTSLDPREGPPDPDSADLDGPWDTEIWFDTPIDEAIGPLFVVGQEGQRAPELKRTLADVRTSTPFLAVVWSLGVLGGLAVMVLVLALLLLAGTRSRADDEAGLELVVLERLGIPRGRQRRAALLERVLLVVVATAVGVLTGTGLAALVASAADPRPQLVPALAVTVPLGLLGGLVAVLVLGGLVAGALDHRAAARADVEEALRVAR